MTSAQKPLSQLKPKIGKRLKFTRMDVVKLSVLYMALSPLVAMPFYNKLLFFPLRDKYDASADIAKLESATDCQKMDLTIPSGTGQKLDAWYFKKRNAKR